MKRFICTLAPVLLALSTMAQKDFYVFIQQNSGQPFYVRMGDKSFSSVEGGYLILPGLKDTGYNFVVGFPKDDEPEQLFLVSLKGSDRGYELKNMNGIWELFDLQTLKFTKATVVQKRVIEQGLRKTDGYSQLLAGVVNDSTVLYGAVVREEPTPGPQAPEPAPVVKKETKMKKKGEAKKAVVVPDMGVAGSDSTAAKDTAAAIVMPDAAVPARVVRGSIVRYGSENTEEGKEIIYLDRTAPVVDTIRITIPRL